MSADPVNDQFAFIKEDPPPLLSPVKSRRSSMRRFWIAFVFISLDLAILGCMLHLLRIVAIPGLPPMGAGTPDAETIAEVAEPTVRTATAVTPAVTKVARPRTIAPATAPNTVRPAEKKPANSAAVEEERPEVVLENEGLKRAGAGYVFGDEEELQKRLEKSRGLFKQTKAAFDQLKQAMRDFNVINNAFQTLDAERTELEAEIAGQQEFVNGLPRVTNVDRANYDDANGRLSVAKARLTEMRRQLDHGRRELPGVTQKKNQALRAYKSKESEFLADGRRLERAFNSRIEEYTSLAKDPKIKKSLEAIGPVSGNSLKLDPSPALLLGRDELKKALKTVESTAVPEM